MKAQCMLAAACLALRQQSTQPDGPCYSKIQHWVTLWYPSSCEVYTLAVASSRHTMYSLQSVLLCWPAVTHFVVSDGAVDLLLRLSQLLLSLLQLPAQRVSLALQLLLLCYTGAQLSREALHCALIMLHLCRAAQNLSVQGICTNCCSVWDVA